MCGWRLLSCFHALIACSAGCGYGADARPDVRETSSGCGTQALCALQSQRQLTSYVLNIRGDVWRGLPSVLWRCWLGGRKGIRPVQTEWWGSGVVICLQRGADLHMAQLMPLPLTVSCFSKIQIGFTFQVPAHPGSPGQRVVKRVCVCVCVCVWRGATEANGSCGFQRVWAWQHGRSDVDPGPRAVLLVFPWANENKLARHRRNRRRQLQQQTTSTPWILLRIIKDGDSKLLLQLQPIFFLNCNHQFGNFEP